MSALWCAEQQFRRLDHGEGFAAALGVPHKATGAVRCKGALDARFHRTGLVLVKDVFVQLLILLGKDDVVLQEGEHLRDGAETLHLGLQLADLLIFPVENVPAHRVPTHPVGEADGIGGGEKLFGHEQLGRLAVITADLIHSEGNRLILAGVLALDHQHGNAVDEKDDILPRTVVAVVKGPFLGHFVHVARRVFVIDQDQVALAALINIEELAPVAQVFDEFPVTVNVGVEMAELAEQKPLGLGIARIEFPHLGIKQVVEEEGQRSGSTPSPLLGFLTGHKRPTDGLGVCQGYGLGRFCVRRGWAWIIFPTCSSRLQDASRVIQWPRPVLSPLAVCLSALSARLALADIPPRRWG